MASFCKLPTEIRLEIAQHIAAWRDFHAFRHVDSCNLQLLSTDSILGQFRPSALMHDFACSVESPDGAAGNYFREMLTVAGIQWHEVRTGPCDCRQFEVLVFRENNVLALIHRLNDDDTKFDPTIGDCDAGTINDAIDTLQDLIKKAKANEDLDDDVDYTCDRLEEIVDCLQGGPPFNGTSFDGFGFTMQRLLAKRMLRMAHELLKVCYDSEDAQACWMSAQDDAHEFYYVWKDFHSFDFRGLI